MKIVIIDDDFLVVNALKTILEVNDDIEVSATGTDGSKAVSLYETHHPDILLMDIRIKGYLLKQDYTSILPALRAVQMGQTVFGEEIISKLPGLLQEKNPFDWSAHDISERELEVVSFVADGLSNREIAKELCLSEGTVRNYISNILDKLKLRDRTQLAVYYLKAMMAE